MARNNEPYTLADGREFPHSSPFPRWERELLAEHVAALSKLRTREERAAKLADIKRSCGAAYAEKLAGQYAQAHAKFKEARHG